MKQTTPSKYEEERKRRLSEKVDPTEFSVERSEMIEGDDNQDEAQESFILLQS